MVKASSIGSGIGGFLSSPFGLGTLGVVALGVGLFIFRDKIADFFSGGLTGLGKAVNEGFAGIGESFSGFQFPSISLPEITFPDFNIFAQQQPPLTQAQQFDFSGLVGGVSPEPTGQPADIFRDAARFAQDFPETFIPKVLEQDFGVTIAPSLLDQIVKPFTGGGISFESGSIFETPIANLSLSQIIDKFMVTASQAASIKAEAIGFTPEEQAFLNQGQEISPLGVLASQPAVSDPQFAGLTLEQIALKLTGGNISNF